MRQALGPGALGRPRGIGWRGRWEGGSGGGTHVNPWLIHVNVWQNPQYCKVISLQLIKINGKKKVHTYVKSSSPVVLYVVNYYWDPLLNIIRGSHFLLLALRALVGKIKKCYIDSP